MPAGSEAPYAAGGQLLKRIRQRAVPPKGRRSWTQELVAVNVVGRTTGAYWHYENGLWAMKAEHIEKFCEELGATLYERRDLYAAFGRKPRIRPCSIQALGSPPGLDDVFRSLKLLIDSDPRPAYLCSGAWEIPLAPRLYNNAYEELAGSVRRIRGHEQDHPSVNPLRFGLFHPDAAAIFYNWEEEWRPAFLAFLKGSIEANPEDPVLKEIFAEVQKRPDLLKAFDDPALFGNLQPMSHHEVERFVSTPLKGWDSTGVNVHMTPAAGLEPENWQILVANNFPASP